MPSPYWCIRLTTHAWKNRLYRLTPKKDCHVYIARSTYHYAYARRRESIGKKETKKRKERKGKERNDKEAKNEKGNKRKDKTRGSKEKEIEKNVILADPRD